MFISFNLADCANDSIFPQLEKSWALGYDTGDE